MTGYESLKLENQLCFPLYVCSKEIIKKYKTLLDELDLTYTQYIVMMVMWNEQSINVKNLGEKLFLDSGTLTPLLKKLEKKGYIERKRLTSDERNLIITITKKGIDLKKQALSIPKKMGNCVNLEPDEMIELHKLLNKMLEKIEN